MKGKNKNKNISKIWVGFHTMTMYYNDLNGSIWYDYIF